MGMDAVALLDRVDDLPPLPAVATRVMTIVDDENANATDLANVLAADQALTAKLIRLSNSAYYGFGRKARASATRSRCSASTRCATSPSR